ncbi:hypothetical protein H6P81_004703 [Aristolochia fimbriata]|uniref:Uncharacterized protein n=1 Tax=Aristolochia fimbriata TaxID=158543 RepID=A0AAV7ET45_ARIFI|nr:hypothetical protein H6P81_004703 [Aristolochia fimbriata]
MEIVSEGEEDRARKRSDNSVIVTVYVQPPTSCWKTTATKGTWRKSDWKPEKPRAAGYNRREQLLAYAQQLRLSELKENQKSGRRWRLRSKKEKRHRASGSKLCGWLPRLGFPVGRRCRYEKIECDDQEKKSSKSNWKATEEEAESAVLELEMQQSLTLGELRRIL